ncbi:hypothetical protein BV20DRAFT_964341 [Pilatotrama ljubarskyi]|nr:hypothetical protein BV20DRAFT_964341 [Pilatotrama ljubarskyi]
MCGLWMLATPLTLLAVSGVNLPLSGSCHILVVSGLGYGYSGSCFLGFMHLP